jgi:hypothetical protein
MNFPNYSIATDFAARIVVRSVVISSVVVVVVTDAP